MLSTYARNLLLDWLYTTGSVTRPTTWFVSFHDGDPALTGANEVDTGTDADYARIPVTFDPASGGLSLSDVDVSHTAHASATAYDITHVGIWDALTAGNFIQGGELAVPEHVAASATVLFATGRIRAALS